MIKPISEKPVFVAGMFKSGTTLLRMMLSQHSAIYSGLDTKWHTLYEEGDSDRCRMLAKLFDAEPEIIEKMYHTSQNGEQFLDVFMSHMTGLHSASRWAEKTPENIMNVDRILAFWPDAKIIHITRDPRDIFVGRRKAKGLSVEKFIDDYRMFTPAEKYFGTSSDAYMEIKYTQLVRDPIYSISEICEFIHLPFEPSMAAFDGNTDDYDRVKTITQKEQTTLKKLTKPITTDYIDVWHGAINEQELNTIRDALSPYYTKLGYDLT